MIRAMNGEDAYKMFRKGYCISIHKNLTPFYVLDNNGAPVMVDKKGARNPLLGNLDAYINFLSKLTKKHVWFCDTCDDTN